MFVFQNNCILLYMMFSSAKNFRGKMTISHHKGFRVPNITNKRSTKNEMKEDQQIKIKTNHCANFSRFVSLELSLSLSWVCDTGGSFRCVLCYYNNNMRWHIAITESRRQHG